MEEGENLNTLLQEIYDSFFAKLIDVDFTYKQDLVFLYFKNAIGYSYKTVPEKLNYSINNDSVFIITDIAKKDGEFEIVLNEDSYLISVFIKDTISDIAEKIKNTLKVKYIVDVDYNNKYPIIKITKNDMSAITAIYNDVNNTGVGIIITRTYDGTFDSELGQDTIELISLFMVKQYYTGIVAYMGKIKQHIGTQSFNKLPDMKYSYTSTSDTLSLLNDEIYKFRQEFYSYQN